MRIRQRFSIPLLFLGATAALTSCGSDDPSPEAERSVTTSTPASFDTSEESTTEATGSTAPEESTTPATDPGDPSSEFCTTAAEAERLGDDVDGALAGSPEELESIVTAALAASEATLELAPPDIVDVMDRTVGFQQRFAAILEENGWDSSKAFVTPEGAQLLDDAETAEGDLDEVRQYLELNCGIEDDSDEPEESVPVQLPEGDEGLRRFIQLYAVGARVEVTDEQEDCFVEELSGNVEVEQLEQALSGRQDEDVKIAIGIAIISCDIPIKD